MAIFEKGVIFAGIDTNNPDCWRLDEYLKRGGYQALKRILNEKIIYLNFNVKLAE